MSLSLMLDIVLLAIFILIVYSCAHKGFVRTLMSLAALIVALLVANSTSTALAQPITERWAAPRMETFLTEKVNEYLPEEALDTFLTVGDKAMAMIRDLIAPDDADAAQETDEEEKASGGYTLEDISHTLSYQLVRWLLFLILAALFYAILRALVENFSFLDRIPIVGTLDALLGVILGVVIGLVVMFVPLMITVNLLPDILGGVLSVPDSFYEESMIMRTLYAIYPFR